MKNRIICLLALLSLLATTTKAEDQLLIRISGGYGLGTQKLLLGEIYTNNSSENIYASFGGNWGFTLGAGLELSKWLDFGVDIGYQNGRSAVIDDAFFDKTFTGRLLTFCPSITLKTDIENNYTPYARIGLLTGYPFTKVNVYDEDKKFRGGFPLGVTEAIGVYLNATEYLSFFAEFNHQTMIYKPTRRIEANGTVIKFRDELPYPAPTNEELTHHFFSFGATGFAIGLKIIL